MRKKRTQSDAIPYQKARKKCFSCFLVIDILKRYDKKGDELTQMNVPVSSTTFNLQTCNCQGNRRLLSKWGTEAVVDLKHELEHLIILTASRCLLGREARDKITGDVASLLHELDNGMVPISIFAGIIAGRKLAGNPKPEMLQSFIDSRYNYKDGHPTTELEVIALLIVALFASQRTSSITDMDWCMDLLYRCIKEALRLHPPAILILRSSHSDFTVTTREGKEYEVPKGQIVATSPALANRLGHIYKDPDRLDLDRRHRCLGESFAYLQIKAIWNHLLRNFELEMAGPSPEIDWNPMVVGIKGKVIVRYKRRVLRAEK
ncbi:hypothetical protein AMTRI_Chr07g79800 [Amborella trichopoda]